MWSDTRRIESSASPERLWALLSDPAGWHHWNAGVASVEMHGPFAAGSTFTMRLPDGTRFESTLLEVTPNEGFTDETLLDATRVVVRHTIERVPGGRTRVSYRSDVTGPDAESIGPSVTADFLDVLHALRDLAESAERRERLGRA